MDGESFKKHSGLIAFFQKEYARSERLDRKHGRALQKAFDDRSDADYEDSVEFSVDQMANRVAEARAFVKAVTRHIESRAGDESERQ
jgi:uncharacterized protein (UPF0332 family)